MRSLFIALIILKSAIGFGQSADFFVEKPLHKFPKTVEGPVLEHTYTVTNQGTAPLIISEYKVACPCTKVVLPDTIAPGASAEIKLTFDTKGKYYQQDRKIILFTNSKKPIQELRFKVYVIPKDESEGGNQ
jgi:hypothetical protein